MAEEEIRLVPVTDESDPVYFHSGKTLAMALNLRFHTRDRACKYLSSRYIDYIISNPYNISTREELLPSFKKMKKLKVGTNYC